jgi:hypothetical protein
VTELDKTVIGVAREYNRDDRCPHSEVLLLLIRTIAAEHTNPMGALKVLHPIADTAAAEKPVE